MCHTSSSAIRARDLNRTTMEIWQEKDTVEMASARRGLSLIRVKPWLPGISNGLFLLQYLCIKRAWKNFSNVSIAYRALKVFFKSVFFFCNGLAVI